MKLLIISLALFFVSALAQNHLVILMYHHVDNGTPPTTSIQPEQFEAHLNALDDLELQVVDLVDALELLDRQQKLPTGAVALTFDDAWQSVYHNAHPILQDRGLPYSIFVPTQASNQERPLSLTWDQMRSLDQQGVRILNHSHDHSSLSQLSIDEAIANIELAQQHLESELGKELPKILAYPYGDYSLALADALNERGYWALGQHSGAFGPPMNWQSIPRYPLDGIYANLHSAKIKMASKPLPLAQENRIDPVTEASPPRLELKLSRSLANNNSLNCFWRNQAMEIEWLDQLTFATQASEPFTGRSRYNCTISHGNEVYWFSQPWIVH